MSLQPRTGDKVPDNRIEEVTFHDRCYYTRQNEYIRGSLGIRDMGQKIARKRLH